MLHLPRCGWVERKRDATCESPTTERSLRHRKRSWGAACSVHAGVWAGILAPIAKQYTSPTTRSFSRSSTWDSVPLKPSLFVSDHSTSPPGLFRRALALIIERVRSQDFRRGPRCTADLSKRRDPEPSDRAARPNQTTTFSGILLATLLTSGASTRSSAVPSARSV
jgi:hypothetical protein